MEKIPSRTFQGHQNLYEAELRSETHPVTDLAEETVRLVNMAIEPTAEKMDLQQ